jgi:hypothetical protein
MTGWRAALRSGDPCWINATGVADDSPNLCSWNGLGQRNVPGIRLAG